MCLLQRTVHPAVYTGYNVASLSVYRTVYYVDILQR